jgi:hypothetical protein
VSARINWTPEMVEQVRQLAGERLTDRGVAERMGIDRSAVIGIRWRPNIPAGYVAQSPKRPPASFAKIGPTMNLKEAARHYGAAIQTVKAWHSALGTIPAARKPGRPPKRIAAPRPPKVYRAFFKPSHTPMAPAPQRDGTPAGSAQLYLQRFGPVFRATTINPNAAPDQWVLFGRRVSEADLIATAYRKGFRAEAMAA